ncbi:stalk domain-containing protein [Lachnospiraceae bacterium NSJ-143]|nr:stalk domain-containing protein [Lachnospiraceae bacterium NSJ-143]
MKKLLCAAVVTAMVFSGTVISNAADIINREAQLRPDFTIKIDDEISYFKSADGEYIYPILYNDSTYLPLRSIGEIIGKNVNWDEDTKTITLSGKRDSYKNTSKSSTAKIKDVDVQERRDFTIIIEGDEVNFKDANGKRVYPLLYNGSTYLPLRAVGEIMGSKVGWDGDDKIITLNSEESTVTDADTFGPDKNSKDIGLEEAKKKAVADADLKLADVEFTKTKTDYDKDTKIYEIDFVYKDWKYEYDINAETGKIISSGKEYYDYKTEGDDKISPERAKQAVLSHAGLKSADVEYLYSWLDNDKYEIEFYYNSSKYEYEVDAYTGKVIEYSKESYDWDKWHNEHDHGYDRHHGYKEITSEEALSAVLKYAGVNSSSVKEAKAKLDRDDRKYEVEFKHGAYEYEADVDLYTGKISDYSKEKDD